MSTKIAETIYSKLFVNGGRKNAYINSTKLFGRRTGGGGGGEAKKTFVIIYNNDLSAFQAYKVDEDGYLTWVDSFTPPTVPTTSTLSRYTKYNKTFANISTEYVYGGNARLLAFHDKYIAYGIGNNTINYCKFDTNNMKFDTNFGTNGVESFVIGSNAIYNTDVGRIASINTSSKKITITDIKPNGTTSSFVCDDITALSGTNALSMSLTGNRVYARYYGYVSIYDIPDTITSAQDIKRIITNVATTPSVTPDGIMLSYSGNYILFFRARDLYLSYINAADGTLDSIFHTALESNYKYGGFISQNPEATLFTPRGIYSFKDATNYNSFEYYNNSYQQYHGTFGYYPGSDIGGYGIVCNNPNALVLGRGLYAEPPTTPGDPGKICGITCTGSKSVTPSAVDSCAPYAVCSKLVPNVFLARTYVATVEQYRYIPDKGAGYFVNEGTVPIYSSSSENYLTKYPTEIVSENLILSASQTDVKVYRFVKDDNGWAKDTSSLTNWPTTANGLNTAYTVISDGGE